MDPKTKNEAMQRAEYSTQVAAKYRRDADGCRGNAEGRKLAARFLQWANEADANASRLTAIAATLPE